jgi:hypothetical protein
MAGGLPAGRKQLHSSHILRYIKLLLTLRHETCPFQGAHRGGPCVADYGPGRSGDLREKAAALRRLASEILDGPFRQRLLALAKEYENSAQDLTDAGRLAISSVRQRTTP